MPTVTFCTAMPVIRAPGSFWLLWPRPVNDPFPPTVTAREMAEVDRIMTEDLAISLDQMMELAGRNLADLAGRFLTKRNSRPAHSRILLLAGSGHNGGGGLTAARHLLNRGLRVDLLVSTSPDRLKPATRRRYHTLAALRRLQKNPRVAFLPSFPSLDPYAIIIDALIGYHLSGEPHGIIRTWIETLKRQPRGRSFLLSLDVPSGFQSRSGTFSAVHLSPDVTLTLGLPKTGMDSSSFRHHSRHLYLADIGIPAEVYGRLGLGVDPALFQGKSVRRLF
ncbi:MAG: NAD(P)H-hydrate epimerase [Candidatus Neomarinimicrobiota bacterium]|nr:MAG: NAD(P)H-hydrate epimerase [Candidatus Neomarinimicrobiota bacterium]